MDTCDSCGADIVWVTSTNEKPMPLDSPAVPAGEDMRGLFAIVMGRKLGSRIAVSMSTFPPTMWPLFTTWRSHFATCPNAAQHRRAS